MIYLLDTNTCIRVLRAPQAEVAARLQTIAANNVALSSVTVFELYQGAYRSAQRERNLGQVERFVQQFIALPLDTRAATVAGQISADLQARGTPIGPYDLLIAAIALANDLTLVTHNTREFSRVAGLRLEDWEITP
jgi:tRNA(fMet)-specific endonuclease VapC